MLSSINHEAYDAENTVSEKKKILLDSDSTLAQVAQAAALIPAAPAAAAAPVVPAEVAAPDPAAVAS